MYSSLHCIIDILQYLRFIVFNLMPVFPLCYGILLNFIRNHSLCELSIPGCAASFAQSRAPYVLFLFDLFTLVVTFHIYLTLSKSKLLKFTCGSALLFRYVVVRSCCPMCLTLGRIIWCRYLLFVAYPIVSFSVRSE